MWPPLPPRNLDRCERQQLLRIKSWKLFLYIRILKRLPGQALHYFDCNGPIWCLEESCWCLENLWRVAWVFRVSETLLWSIWKYFRTDLKPQKISFVLSKILNFEESRVFLCGVWGVSGGCLEGVWVVSDWYWTVPTSKHANKVPLVSCRSASAFPPSALHWAI